jgi:RHS repeat-associated protein
LNKQYAKINGIVGQSTEITYFHQDNLGSTRLMTDASANVVMDQDYLPFGGDLARPNQIEVQNDTNESYKYTGQKQVVSIGLYYYGARYYDPEIGRFTREDSYRGRLHVPQNQNLYLYVLNNPLKYTDPDGHDYLGIGEALDDLAEKGELPWDRTARELTFMDYMKGLNEVKHFFDSDTDRLLNHYRQSDEYFEWQLTSKEANYLRSIKLAKTGVEVAGFVELGAAAYGEYKASKSVAKLDNLASEARFFDEFGSWMDDTVKSTRNHSKWWHENYVDDLTPSQTILGVKQSPNGLSTLGSSSRSNAWNAGKAWVGEGANTITNSSGKVIGYSSSDKMRAFRFQYKKNEKMLRANFQQNLPIKNRNGQWVRKQFKNVHIDIID